VRVALVGPYPLDRTRVAGGVETSFLNLLQGLRETEGVEPHVVTFSTDVAVATTREDDGVPIRFLPGTRRLANLTFHLRERRLLRAALPELRPDLVHAQDALRYGYVCLGAASDVPVVVSVHGIVREELRLAEGFRRRLQIRLAGVSLERHCIRSARFLVAPTRYAEQYFGDEIRGRIWDVGNAILGRFFSVTPAPEPGWLLSVGAVIPRKRLLDLVDAVPHVVGAVPSSRLSIVGVEPDPAYSERVRARIRELGLEERVAFRGAVGLDELLEEYRRASVFVLPSGEETSPMVIGEAMAAGVPVVATRVGGVPYLVDEGVTGDLVAPGDVPGLSERLRAILRDDSRRAAYGAAARLDAERRFRPASVGARMREVYDEVLREASGYSPR
jgi:glycosyltransferase involved in cell wall biosynthesis